MEVNDYFEKDYIPIEPNSSKDYKLIEEFLDECLQGEELRYHEPLKSVFIHKTKNEMFLILDCLAYDWETVGRICEQWEEKVLSFINFGQEFRENIEFLMYNISLIILCKKEILSNNSVLYENEKSVTICKKLFLSCDDNGKVVDEDKTIIPFYFEPIKYYTTHETAQLEEEMKDLLPQEIELKSIFKKETLDKGDMEKIGRWLIQNDNN